MRSSTSSPISRPNPGQIPAKAAAYSRVRREGTRNLIAAAQAAGTPRFLAQSVAFELAGGGAGAVRDHERAVLNVGGVVLRYGYFWGPGTYNEDAPGPAPAVHVAHASRRTVEALDAASGVITIIDTGQTRHSPRAPVKDRTAAQGPEVT